MADPSARPPRVRIAPAPTGALHVGNLRAGLYNFLHARRTGGVFILRIEDTDRSRSTDEAMAEVLRAFRWSGLDWNEGPEVGGSYGPYRQSERAPLYAAVAARLRAVDGAYPCYCSPEELEQRRREASAAGRPPIYDGRCRDLTSDERAAREAEGRAPTLRVRTPDEGEIVVHDLVRGDVTFGWDNVGDFIVARADGTTTYPLANAIDDVAQGITLVSRGEDLLSVTPRQMLVYELITRDRLLDDSLAEVGLPAREPDWSVPAEFAHLPLIVADDRKPLSKRHGSVAVQQFAAEGYLPDVLVNYIALLGWSPGGGVERMTLDEMIERFSFDGVSKTPAAFDRDKLAAFNGERIRALPPDELALRLVPFLDGTYGVAVVASPPTAAELETLRGLVPLVQERMQRLAEVQAYAPPFFRREIELDPASVADVLAKEGAGRVLDAGTEALRGVEPWTVAAIEEALRSLPGELGLGAKKVFQPIRVAVTGSKVSPPLFESIALLARDVVLERIAAARPLAG